MSITGPAVRRLGGRSSGAPAGEKPALRGWPLSPASRKEPTVSKYLLLYRGPATAMEDFTPEQSAEQMKAWTDWMGRVGSALVDGDTIVEAGSVDGARALTDGHPFLSEGKGRFTIEIFELMPM
jgi:hypothetical protein